MKKIVKSILLVHYVDILEECSLNIMKHHGLSEEDIDRMNLSQIAKASSNRMRDGQILLNKNPNHVNAGVKYLVEYARSKEGIANAKHQLEVLRSDTEYVEWGRKRKNEFFKQFNKTDKNYFTTPEGRQEKRKLMLRTSYV